jgi:acetyl-CoA C-acetyltransferase
MRGSAAPEGEGFPVTKAVVVAGCRTAIGTAFKGSLADVSAVTLGATVVAELVSRTGVSPADIDDLVLAESLQGGGVLGRYIAVELGMSAIPGVALNRHCASGLSAVTTAAADIVAGMQDVVIAGGTHSQSMFPRTSMRDPKTNEFAPWMSASHPDTPTAPAFDMSITVGHNTAVEAGITRADMDEWALESHRKAVAATDDGRLAREIVPLKLDRGDEGTVVFEVDEHPRRTTTADKLASLPVLHPEIDGFAVTAGNSSGLNDAAAALMVMSEQSAAAFGLTPLASITSWSVVGVEPERTGMAPIDAIPRALHRAGRNIGDVDLWEINEAFASVPIAASRALGIDPALVNPVGSGCSLGHPIAASGARMLVSLIHELQRRGGGTGVAAMCAGGGMGAAVLLDVYAA